MKIRQKDGTMIDTPKEKERHEVRSSIREMKKNKPRNVDDLLVRIEAIEKLLGI